MLELKAFLITNNGLIIGLHAGNIFYFIEREIDA